MRLTVIVPSKNEKNVVQMVDDIEKLSPAQIVIYNDRYGRGKGWAIREALKEATGDVICFIDADRDIPARMINRLIPFLEDYDIVIGKKRLTGSWQRKVITLFSRVFIGLVFGLWIQTQVGIKVFKRSALPSWDNDSFAFDIEILSKAKKAGMRIIEVPVEVSINKGMPLSSIFKFMRGAAQIKCRK